ncbi:MAG: sensor histidine kinase [Proteobacteria bacterium]|nr:sensor histidine kinase [Pseudomonadota bacterium]
MPLLQFEIDQVTDSTSWRALRLFSGYRLFLAAMLFFVFYLKLPPEFLGESAPVLYSVLSQFYLLTAVVLMVFTSKHWGLFQSQTKIQLVIDILVITLLIHASGGLKTGLGSLLLVVVIAGGALIPGRISVFIAAVATLSVLLEAGYSQIAGDGVTKYSQAGLLGATFFATALLAQSLAKKMKKSQILAEQRAQDVTKLAALNERIISRMQTGILVIDFDGKVTRCNKSARSLLDISKPGKPYQLKHYVPQLAEQIWAWKHHNATTFVPFQARADLPEVLVRASELDGGEILIYIDNTSAMAQQVQQLKLASLGRLTASIAHEVRNPLGAISHAGELLAEAYCEDKNITKLTDIIQRHSAKVNGIIETILDMSRRNTVEPTVVVLAPWLEKFINEFCEIKHIPIGAVELIATAPLAKAYMDAEQLHQVMCNLMENAWHYSDKNAATQKIQVTLSSKGNEISIDISDNGAGITEEVQQHLFEPFHSQRTGGTGLGLYLARVLCQANGARLNYLPDEKERCCFRINVPLDWQESVQ